MKKSLSFILVLACLMTSVLVSCADDKADEGKETETTAQANTETTGTDAESESEVETEPELTLNLPECDYDSTSCTMLIRTSKIPHFYAEDFTGEALNDAVYERNNTVSELLSVTLDYVDLPDDNGGATFNSAISNSVLARDGAYDIVAPDYWWKTEINGWFLNLKEVERIDLTQPWWCQGWNDAATFNGILPGAVGYYTLDMIQNMNMIYFNKDIYSELNYDSVYNLDGIYNTVREGKWTWDLFCQMSAAAAQDLDGDGKLTSAKDRFGSVSGLQSGRAILWSNGLELCARDEQGNITATLTTEENYDIFKSALTFYEDKANLYAEGSGCNMFQENRALFFMAAINDGVYLRDMESDFGALPYPKYHETDESYRNRNLGTSYFAIPITANNAEMSATVLEAQNFYSYRDVRPTYYDTILKGKVSRDEESREMLDLVLDTCYVDTFFVYGSNLSGVADTPFTTVLNGNDTYMSAMKTHEKVIKKLLGKMEEALAPQPLD